MSYKGNDLDLRTPYARPLRGTSSGEDGGPPGAWQRAEPGRAAPIPVDDTVLAACNVARDAALFLGAGHVAPVHLLHALTRVDAARQALERHGVGVHQLRRASAAAIAADAPASGTDTGVAPRTSPELEQLLRRATAHAAAHAGVHGAPASVRDVVRALLGAGRETPAAALLLDAAADPDALARWGTEAPVPAPDSALQTAAVERLTARVGELEATVRTLAGELGRAVAGLAERFEAIRAFAPGEGSDLPGRLSALEAALAAQPSQVADAVAYMLSQPRAGAEGGPGTGVQAANGGSPAGTDGLADRLAGLEAVLRAHGERQAEASRTHERDFAEIFEALVKLGTNQHTLGSNLEAWRLDSSGDVSIVSNRLEAMERTLREVLPRPRPERPPAEPSPPLPDGGPAGEDPQARSFRRWLYGTGRVLPASWREDMNAIRETLRPRRRNGGT